VRLIDITVPLRDGMPIYPGDPEVMLTRAHSLLRGDLANVSRLALGCHSGTHIDAPVHFIEGGPDADDIPLDPLIGDVRVLDLTDAIGAIDAAALERAKLPRRIHRVLLRTRVELPWDHPDPEQSVRLDEGGARRLLQAGVRLVGIDDLSVGDPPAHRLLLRQHVVALEGLDLCAVAPGRYELLCLPLRIEGSDGAPARALLGVG
jgi:arylformamidase